MRKNSSLALDGDELNQLVNTLNLFASEIRRYSSELLLRYRITAPQLAVLRVLLAAGELRLSDLSERINLANSTITGIIERLERARLIVRQRSAGDRRVVLVRLTPQGRKTAERVPAPHLAVLREAFLALPRKDRDELLRLLRKFHLALIRILFSPDREGQKSDGKAGSAAAPTLKPARPGSRK